MLDAVKVKQLAKQCFGVKSVDPKVQAEINLMSRQRMLLSHRHQGVDRELGEMGDLDWQWRKSQIRFPTSFFTFC